jgi:PAS domain S-box-containing protein
MRDQHKPKQELIEEITALRKQVADLKEAGLARRRVEDALRAGEELYRSMVEALPAGICRLGPRGELLLANAALANFLGYSSKVELLQLAAVLGLFTSRDDERRVRDANDGALSVQLRRKDGTSVTARLHAARTAHDGLRIVDLLVEPEAVAPAP